MLALGTLLGELQLALLVGLARVGLLDKRLDVDLLLILLLFADGLRKLLHFLFQFGIFFLLHDELPDQALPVVFLGLELLLELGVLLDKLSVFSVDPLSNVRDQLQVVLHFILSVLEVSFLIALERLLLFHGVSHLLHLRVEFADDVLLLLLLQLLHLGIDLINDVLDQLVGILNHLRLDVWLLGLVVVVIRKANDLLANHSDLEVLLQLIDLLSVVSLSFRESLLSPLEIILYLVVLVHHFLRLFDDLGEAFVPVARLRVLVSVWDVQVNFLHCIGVKIDGQT